MKGKLIIIIVTCNEVQLRFWCLIYAVCGVLSTSFYQVWVTTRQQDLGLSPPQLLYYQVPISAIMVFLVTPIEISDPNKRIIGLVDYDFLKGNVLYFILVSCILALWDILNFVL